jgi:hypothetical protein
MAVEITDSCDRCGRSESLHITHDELIERTQRIKAAEETADNIEGAILEIYEGASQNFPEVVTVVKTETGIKVQSKISLCGPDEERKRGGQGCESRVAKLVDEIHLDKKKE